MMSPELDDAGRPLYAHDWPALLEQARSALAQRQQAYPAWIERGRLTREEADHDIRGWELLVAEWQWIVSAGESGERPPFDTLHIRRDAVALSLQRIDAELQRGNRSHTILRQAHLVQALHWHLHRLRWHEPAVLSCVDLTRACRADLAARQQETAAA
jgi:hypothetical protein